MTYIRYTSTSLSFPSLLYPFLSGFTLSIVSEAFKERPRPRKPDYLRESFDVTQITTGKNLPPSAPSTRVTTKGDDETKPRPTQPQPCYQTRNNIHPHQRNPREESIVFPSSSGEESFNVAEAPKETGKDTYGKKPQHVSLLCFCFVLFCFFSIFFFKRTNLAKMPIIVIVA